MKFTRFTILYSTNLKPDINKLIKNKSQNNTTKSISDRD